MGHDNLLPTDKHLINIDRAILIGQSMIYKEEWLKTIESARTCKMPREFSTFNYSRAIFKQFLTKAEQTKKCKKGMAIKKGRVRGDGRGNESSR